MTIDPNMIARTHAMREAWTRAFDQAVLEHPEGRSADDLEERMWRAMIHHLGPFWPSDPETLGVDPSDEPPDSIQQRLAQEMPDLLQWFRSRAVPMPMIDATTNGCGRCGLVVAAGEEETHLKWHESLSIGMDALAGLCIVGRERTQ